MQRVHRGKELRYRLGPPEPPSFVLLCLLMIEETRRFSLSYPEVPQVFSRRRAAVKAASLRAPGGPDLDGKHWRSR